MSEQLNKRVAPERWLTGEQIATLFLISGYNVFETYEIANPYWPKNSEYDEVRWPWWLVRTEYGLIEFGWRKSVASINWKDTGRLCDLTDDSVTKEDYFVHANSYSDVIKYLAQLRRWLLVTPEVYQRCIDEKRRP